MGLVNPFIMVDGIGISEIGLGTGWIAFFALAFLVLRAVVKGQLIPRVTHEDVVHDRDEWRGESRIKDAQLSEKDSQLAKLSEVGEMVKQLVSSLRRNAEGASR